MAHQTQHATEQKKGTAVDAPLCRRQHSCTFFGVRQGKRSQQFTYNANLAVVVVVQWREHSQKEYVRARKHNSLTYKKKEAFWKPR